MITEPTDTRDQWRLRAGQLVGDNVHLWHSLVAKAALFAPAKRLRSNRMRRKMASSCSIAFSDNQMAVSRALR